MCQGVSGGLFPKSLRRVARGGTYVPEKDWTGRWSGAWVIVDENWLP